MKGVTDIYRANLLPKDPLREAARNLLASAPKVTRESPSGTVSVRIADMLALQEALEE